MEGERASAEVVREYGPFPGVRSIHGVTHDGEWVWFGSGEHLVAFDPESGEVRRTLEVASDAGTAFDGAHIYQIAGDKIQKVDPKSGEIVGTIPAPGKGKDSGMAWADGALWVGQYRDRRIHKIDPATGAILKTLESDRFVTGVTWVDGALWHGTGEGESRELRRVDVESGRVLEALEMPKGHEVSGVESDGNHFFCGSGSQGVVRKVKRAR